MWERGLQLGEGGDAAVYGAYPSMARADFQLGSLLFVCRNVGNASPDVYKRQSQARRLQPTDVLLGDFLRRTLEAYAGCEEKANLTIS